MYKSLCPYHHNYQTLPQQCQLSEITTMNAIGDDSAASLSLVSKACFFLQIPNREGTLSHPVIKSRGPNRQLFVVLVKVPVSIHMLTIFANFGNVLRS